MPGYVDERRLEEWEGKLEAEFDSMLDHVYHEVLTTTNNRAVTAAAVQWNGDHYSVFDLGWWKRRVKRRLRPIIKEVQVETGKEVAERIDIRFDLHNPLVTEAIDRQTLHLQQYGDTLRTRVGDILREGEHDGLSIPNIAKRLRETGEFSRETATRVARTEVVSASNNGAITSVRAAGSETHPYKRWLSTHDARTRPTHEEANGQQVLLEGKFTVGGFEADHPGDLALPAEERVNCRCRVVFDREQKPGYTGGLQTKQAAAAVRIARASTAEVREWLRSRGRA